MSFEGFSRHFRPDAVDRVMAEAQALLARLPLHAALLAPGAAEQDPFAADAPPLDPAHFRGPGGFTAMHAAALANAPDAIARLKKAGSPVDSRLADGAWVDDELQLLLAAVPPGPAKFAAETAVRGGATPLALAVVAARPAAVTALLAAGADPHARLACWTKRWDSDLPLIMYCIFDPGGQRV